MALTQTAVVDTAVDILTQFGLADLSMRRLARELDVQVGALYWHVKNKQELLVYVAARLLNVPSLDVRAAEFESPVGALKHLAQQLYFTLLPIQDGAEVIEVARTLRPEDLQPLVRTTELLEAMGLSGQEAGFGRQLVLNHILGSVAHRQNIVDLDVQTEFPDGFAWGLDRLLKGLTPGGHCEAVAK